MRSDAWLAMVLAFSACVVVKEGGDPADTGTGDDTTPGGLEVCQADDCVCVDVGCDIDCTGAGDCDTQCTNGQPCDVACNGAPTCDVQATGGDLIVDCTGVGSCDVECSTADSCTVDCAGEDCDVTCPSSGCTVTNCEGDCTVVCGFVPQFPQGGTVECN